MQLRRRDRKQVVAGPDLALRCREPILDELDRLGLTRRKIAVFWSDRGYHLGVQTLWAKTSK